MRIKIKSVGTHTVLAELVLPAMFPFSADDGKIRSLSFKFNSVELPRTSIEHLIAKLCMNETVPSRDLSGLLSDLTITTATDSSETIGYNLELSNIFNRLLYGLVEVSKGNLIPKLEGQVDFSIVGSNLRIIFVTAGGRLFLLERN
ncbi:hypothetical protein HZC07_02130, partial [Candidatus Micrarchaeota archaeon]|nr:hypothetical protein [Candidatus Micrarchaeota archaeon]